MLHTRTDLNLTHQEEYYEAVWQAEALRGTVLGIYVAKDKSPLWPDVKRYDELTVIGTANRYGNNLSSQERSTSIP